MIWLIRIALLPWMGWWNFKRGKDSRPLGIAMMTLAMSLYWAWFTHIWWMLLAVGIPMGITIGLGDKNRGLWCLRISLAESLAPAITGYLFGWWAFLIVPAYCGFSYFLGWFTNDKLKLVQKKTDWITGIGFGLIDL